MAKQTTKKERPGVAFIGVYLPEELKEFISAEANRRYLSISDVVREALFRYKEKLHGHV